jgi:hypothetical protein
VPDAPMKIAVIGTINRDLILPFEAAPIQSLGGIFYTVSALSELGGNQIELYPVSFIGNDLTNPFESGIDKNRNINSSGLYLLDQKNHKVILEYKSPEERVEQALLNFPALEWKQIKPFLSMDFYLVNLITGWDISLKAYHKLSRKKYDRMCLDIHFLVMGIDDMGRRFPQCPEDIKPWLQGSRFIQMNQREFEIITDNSMHYLAFYEQHFKKDQVLIITLGRQGARIIYRKEKKIRHRQISGFTINNIADTTGCGDVFGAAFVWEYLSTGDINLALEFANKAGAANCLLKGSDEMDLLPLKIEEFKY